MKRMTTVLREMMAEDGIIVHPGVHDAISAKIAELAGFRMVAMGGTSLGLHLGVGEPRLHQGDLVDISRYVTAAINIPLKVDAGPGFGDPVQIVRTIHELENAGVAACHIEDGVFPIRATHSIGIDPVIDADEMIEKIKVAVAAKRDPDFVIIGRSNAMSEISFAEGVRRANLYLEAGADAAYVFPNNMEEARLVPKEINGPCVFNNSEGGSKPSLTVQEAEDLGYKFLTFPVMSTIVTCKALMDSFKYLMEHGTVNLSSAEMKETMKPLLAAVGMNEMCDMELKKDKMEQEKREKGER